MVDSPDLTTSIATPLCIPQTPEASTVPQQPRRARHARGHRGHSGLIRSRSFLANQDAPSPKQLYHRPITATNYLDASLMYP
jgi:hypothetical protein